MGKVSLKDKSDQTRVAALSLIQMTTVVTLLRAHGETEHAERVESAKNAVIAIIVKELGRDTLAHAMKCVSDEVGCDTKQFGAATLYH